MGIRRALPLVLAASVVTGACAGVPGPSAGGPTATVGVASAIASRTLPGGATAVVDDASWALADRLTAPTYSADTTAAMQAALARAGIAVVADTSTDPATATPEVALTAGASPFELLDFQAHALAVGAWAGATWSGAELDAVVPVPASTGSPTTSELLAAYVGSVDSPGAALSRALMAGQDLLQPASLRFPAGVLVMFVSDLATDGGRIAAPNPSPKAARPGPMLALATTGHAHPDAVDAIDVGLICAGPSGWIDAIIGRIATALSSAAPTGVAGVVIVGIFHWFVKIGAAVIKGLIDGFTAPVRLAIQGIAAIVSGIAQQIMTVLPYAVHVTTDGGGADGRGTFRLGPAPLRGTFTAQVTAGDFPDWPAVLATCAKAAGIALPQPITKGVPLSWGPLTPNAPLLSGTDQAMTEMTTDDHATATWPFMVARDPGDAAGEEKDQIDRQAVAVHRPELDDARARLTTALFGGIWAPIRPFVVAAFKPILDDLQGRLNTLLDERGVGTANLIYHEKAPPSPSPSSASSGATACGVTLPAGTYTGTITSKSTTIVPPGQIDLGESGGTNDTATGPLTVSVGSDGTVGGTFKMTMQEHTVYEGLAKGTTDTTVEQQGAGVSGTLCSLTLTFASETITDCKATGHGTCGAVGITIPLAGLVPPLPMGAPKTVSADTLTWSISTENGFDAGFGGLSAEVQSTITVTLSAW